MGQKMVVAISNSCYVVYCFLLDPISNFIKIGWKTQKLKIFYIGRFWLVGLVGRKMLVGISNSFYVVFGPILVPIPNFIKIGRKTQKLKIFTWSVLVGRAGRLKNGRSHFKHSVSIQRLTNNLCTKFEPNRMKIGRVSPSWNFFPKIRDCERCRLNKHENRKINDIFLLPRPRPFIWYPYWWPFSVFSISRQIAMFVYIHKT